VRPKGTVPFSWPPATKIGAVPFSPPEESRANARCLHEFDPRAFPEPGTAAAGRTPVLAPHGPDAGDQQRGGPGGGHPVHPLRPARCGWPRQSDRRLGQYHRVSSHAHARGLHRPGSLSIPRASSRRDRQRLGGLGGQPVAASASGPGDLSRDREGRHLRHLAVPLSGPRHARDLRRLELHRRVDEPAGHGPLLGHSEDGLSARERRPLLRYQPPF